MSKTFKTNDRVRCFDRSPVGDQFGVPGEMATVIAMVAGQVELRFDRDLRVKTVIADRFEKVVEIIAPKVTPGFKIGDRVVHYRLAKTGVGEITAVYSDAAQVKWANGWNCRDPFDAIKPAPRATSAKTWIISLIRDGQLLPAEEPRHYSSAEQARAVARKMAEKHVGDVFMVLEATDAVTATKKVVETVESNVTAL